MPQANPQTPAKITPEQIAAENELARDGTDNDALIERGATETLDQNHGDPADTGVTRRETIQRSPQDDMRSQIAARFRRTEPDGERPFDGDFSNPENVAGRVAETDDEDDSDDDLADLGLTPEQIARARGQKAATESDDEDESLLDDPPQRRTRQQQDQQPKKHKIKLQTGEVLELTDEEVLTRASKVSAADAYLEEARNLLKEAKAIRAGRTASHSGENDTETGDLGTDPPELDAQDHEPSTRSVIEKIQFADPDEAAAELDRLIDARAGKKATEGQLQRVMKQDFAKSQKQLKEFADANPQLANNKVAALAIESGMYDGYRQDIEALGVNPADIPTDNATLANWHRFYRVNGYDVRSTKDLLEGSKKEFVKSLGEFGVRRQQEPSRQRTAPRVNVNVDRDQRRMAIPTQPTRSVSPRRDVDPRQRPQTGSDVVNQMRRQRGQPVV